MFVTNVIRYPGIPRTVKKYWERMLTCFFITFVIVILIVKWKYGIELTRLEDLTKAHIKKIRQMVELSTAKSRINDTWRTLDDMNEVIFSAYLDSRPEVVLEEVFNASYENLWALIRIIAILDVNTVDSPRFCYYKFTTNSLHTKARRTVYLKSPSVAVRIIAKIENINMRYAAFFVLCKLVTTNDGKLPLEITFSTKSGQTYQELEEKNFVDVRYTTRANVRDQDRFMAACVPSLHHGYDKHANLIEFIEFYRMMGVEHFTFYNTSVTEEVSRVLAHYQDEGVATVLQWNIPAQYVFEKNLRYNGIFAALNECLYRNTMVGGFKYVVNVDLDEFIVPRLHENFWQMMKFLDPASDDGKYASFIFRNMFFYLIHKDNPIPQNPPDIPKLLLHAKTTRLEQIYPAYQRSKYIVRGQEIIEMGNHQVWRTRRYSLVFRTSYGERFVDPDIAGSQHYRNCDVSKCSLRSTVVDVTAHKYTNELGIRVAAALAKIFPKSVH